MAYAASFDCAMCGTLCEFRAANHADSGLCDECYAAQSACLYCGAQMSEDEGPHCGACFAAMYGPTDGGAA